MSLLCSLTLILLSIKVKPLLWPPNRFTIFSSPPTHAVFTPELSAFASLATSLPCPWPGIFLARQLWLFMLLESLFHCEFLNKACPDYSTVHTLKQPTSPLPCSLSSTDLRYYTVCMASQCTAYLLLLGHNFQKDTALSPA